MFGSLGPGELLLIFVIALIIFGPRKLPELGKSLGRMMFEFRKASTDLQRTIEDEVEADRRREASALKPAEPESHATHAPIAATSAEAATTPVPPAASGSDPLPRQP